MPQCSRKKIIQNVDNLVKTVINRLKFAQNSAQLLQQNASGRTNKMLIGFLTLETKSAKCRLEPQKNTTSLQLMNFKEPTEREGETMVNSKISLIPNYLPTVFM